MMIFTVANPFSLPHVWLFVGWTSEKVINEFFLNVMWRSELKVNMHKLRLWLIKNTTSRYRTLEDGHVVFVVEMFQEFYPVYKLSEIGA